MSPIDPESPQQPDGVSFHEPRSETWTRADLSAWLSACEDLSDAEAVDEACAHLIAHWEQKRHVPVEAYLGLHPALGPGTEGAYELIYTEYTLRRERGEEPGVEEYAHRFPGFATRFRRQAALDEAIDRATADTLGHGSNRRGEDPYEDDRDPGEEGWPDLPRFEIVEELGRGAMGVVYKAREIGLGRIVALKMMLAGEHGSDEALPRFLAEARTIARLVHPNIVQIHSIGEHQGRPFLELEYVAGGSLASRLDGKPWPAERAAGLVLAIARGIEQAHGLGVIHRDLKPANILLAHDDTPRVADFGVAKLLDGEGSLTHTRSLVGSPSYMAPEQADWEVQTVGPTADVYSLGAILYELLTGRPPFRGTNVLNTLEQVRSSEPVPPARLVTGIPRDLETITLKCLEKSSARRYPSAQSLIDDLGRFLRREPIQARPAHALERARRWCSRHPAIAGLVLALATAIGLGVSGIVWNWRIAVNETRKADRLRIEAEAARNESQRLLAGLDLERAFTRANEYEVGDALIWMLESLRQTPPEDAGFARVVRRNLTAWSGQTDVLRQVFTFPTAVTAVDFTPDGRRLGVGLEGNEVRFVDPLTREARGPNLQFAGPVNALAIHPDGKTFVCGGETDMRLRDIDTGEPVGRPMPHPELPFRLAFSPDGRFLISTCRTACAFVWDGHTGEPLGRLDLPAPEDRCFGVAFGPSGTMALTASTGVPMKHGGSVDLWDLGGDWPSAPRTRLAHTSAVVAVHISTQGDRIATGSDDRSLRIWDVASGQLTFASRPLPSVVEPVKFRPDGTELFAGCGDGVGRWCDARTGNVMGSPLQHESGVWAVGFSRDGKLMATGSLDRTVRVWELASRDRLMSTGTALPGDVPVPAGTRLDVAAYSPDRSRLASGDTRGNLRILDLASGRVIADRSAHPNRVTSIEYSANGSRIATLDEAPDKQGVLKTWTADGEPLATMRHGAPFIALDFSADGRLCAASSYDHKVFVWETDTGRPVVTPWTSVEMAWGLAIRPDGGEVAVTDASGLVIRDVQTGKTTREVNAPVDRVAYRHDGRLLLTREGRLVRIFDAATGAVVGSPLRAGEERSEVSFFPRKGLGSILAWDRQGYIRHWSDTTGEPKWRPIRASSSISALDVDDRGAFLLSGGVDGAVQLWDLPTGLPIGRPIKLDSGVIAVGFDRDSQTFTVVVQSGEVRRWSIPEPLEGDVRALTDRFVTGTARRLDSGRTVVPVLPEEWLARDDRVPSRPFPSRETAQPEGPRP